MGNLKKTLVILGPTTTGKTDLSLYLAKKFQGDLVAADSRQVYQGLDIGTGKYPGLKCKTKSAKLKKQEGFWEIDGIKVWMYDVVDLKKQYTVYGYVKDANLAVEKIYKKGKLPIVVGGTGLYIKGLLEGFSNLEIPLDQKLRKKLLNIPKGQLQQKLQKISPDKWKSLNESDKQNPRRLIRVIELIINQRSRLPKPGIGGQAKIKDQNDKSKIIIENVNYLKIGLSAPREILYQRINKKAEEWIEEGIIEEVEQLIKQGISKERITQLGLEYKVIVQYLDNKISLNEMLIKMQTKVRQYAKRQLTWFKKEKGITWFDVASKDYLDKVEKLVAKWYD